MRSRPRTWTIGITFTLTLLAGAITWTVLSSAAEPGEPEDVPRAPAAQAGNTDGPPALPNTVAAQLRSAPAGTTVARGPSMTVDEVPLTAPISLRAGAQPVSEVLRLRIDGDFPLRALDPTVLIDGKPVGRGIGAVDQRSLNVGLEDVRTGTEVSYRYGTGPATTVGTLTREAR
ncbi:hypothetical protein [Amycolatopsis nigrescens]|uniref:hypothetical protein n=1 Tax=Amycolatopsis nigrescens TaxID=381445 RepID=UPI0003A16EA9|nr:hypothetical protein [Amycolatopsis nigrescens]